MKKDGLSILRRPSFLFVLLFIAKWFYYPNQIFCEFIRPLLIQVHTVFEIFIVMYVFGVLGKIDKRNVVLFADFLDRRILFGVLTIPTG